MFTDQHTGQLAEVPAARMRTVVDAWADRTEALMREPGWSRSTSSKTAARRSA
ncbi:hypothetical protein [Nesterenkonia pannonica]|uniref:hypothetical protein n=1 Tax=Nesterenkonia pannonica TaxID=1548602 RepID=UPI0021648E0E|nr:hypothetical protein [Nesterenkonia pannonica]